MNSIVFCISLALSALNDTTCRDKFYEEAVKDTVPQYYGFVKLNAVDSSGRRKSILTFNHSLYHFYQRKGLSYDSYKKYIKGVLSSKQAIQYSDYNELPLHVTLIRDDYVELIAARGKQALIKHFFENRLFKFEYQKHFEAVVGKLFDYGIRVSMVHNGNEAIVYEADCF